MIAVLAIASALVGALGSAVATGKARRSLALAGMTASFLFAASGAVRAAGDIVFAWWPGWPLHWSVAEGGGLTAAAVAGAYLAEVLGGDGRSKTAVLLSAAGGIWAALGTRLETVLPGWILCWAPLLVVLRQGGVPVALAVRNLLAGFGLLLLAAVGPSGPWATWVLPAGAVLAAGIFPAHAWLGACLPESGGSALLHVVATRLPLLYWIRSGTLQGLSGSATATLQVLALLGVVHAMLVAWTYRRRPRAFLSSTTVLLNATLLLAALAHGTTARVGGLLLGSTGLLAQTAAWWALETDRGDVAAGSAWVLVGLPGSGLLPGLLLVVLGFFVSRTGLAHARATASLVAAGWFIHSAALVRAWTEAQWAGRARDLRGTSGGPVVRRRAAGAALLVLGLSALLGFWPRFWVERLTRRPAEGTTLVRGRP